MCLLVPIPRVPVHVRVATTGDLAFIDSLQKIHSKQVGFLRRAALEGKIAAGEVLIAEEVGGQTSGASPLGYVIGTDRYFKREDVGIIYQLNVVPGISGSSSGRRCSRRCSSG